MINAGVGQSQMSNILAELNIPQPVQKTIKRREREVGKTIEDLAEKSCSVQLEKEKQGLKGSGDEGAKVILDGGWQKRGSGRTNNSMSGHLMVIGLNTKRCIDFGVAKKSCRICKTTKTKLSTKKHDCRRNFKGSSKAMESFLAVNTLQKIQEKGLKISKVVMDDDSTTYSKIKTSINGNIIKCSDTNHVMKNFATDLYKIKESNKSLTKKNISHLQKCFNYAITQNKGHADGIKSNLEAIIPHVYGTHELCEDKQWCSYHSDPLVYNSKKTPNNRKLEDQQLRNKLESTISKYCQADNITKLCNLTRLFSFGRTFTGVVVPIPFCFKCFESDTVLHLPF